MSETPKYTPSAAFVSLITQLKARGIRQREIAIKIGITGQLLSDLLAGRRRLTELCARRLAEAFGVADYSVFLDDVRAMRVTVTITAPGELLVEEQK